MNDPMHDPMQNAAFSGREIVIVDRNCDRYAAFLAAAKTGEIGLHFCYDGGSALRLARRFRADAWLVAIELPDMSGLDLAEMLTQTSTRAGHASTARPGVFVVADGYRLEDEQGALAAGVAGYLVEPVSPRLILGSMEPALPARTDSQPNRRAARSGVAPSRNLVL